MLKGEGWRHTVLLMRLVKLILEVQGIKYGHLNAYGIYQRNDKMQIDTKLGNPTNSNGGSAKRHIFFHIHSAFRQIGRITFSLDKKMCF